MRFLDIWRFWVLKETSSQRAQSVPSSKSDGNLSTPSSSSHSSLWGRRKSKKKRLKMKKSAQVGNVSCGSDSGFTTDHNVTNATTTTTDKFHQKERYNRFKEAQRFWESFGKSTKLAKYKKCSSHNCHVRSGSRFRRRFRCRPCEICHKCMGPKQMAARFHVECLTCTRCRADITDKKNTTPFENKLFCSPCDEAILNGKSPPPLSSSNSSNSNCSKLTAATVISRGKSTKQINHDSDATVDDLYSLPNLSSSGTPRSSLRRQLRKKKLASTASLDESIDDLEQHHQLPYNERLVDDPISTSSCSTLSGLHTSTSVLPIDTNFIKMATSLRDLPGSSSFSRSEGSDSDGFFDDDFDRLISSSPLHGPPHHHQPGKFFSQQVSPILTRHRSLTASQVIRNRFHDRWEIRRSSVELNKVKNGAKDNTTKDLSRSESMRLGGAVHRAFRPSEFVEEEILGNGFFASATKVYHKTSGETMVSKRLHRYEGEERDCFLKEVKVLRSIRHKNVLRFIGVIYKGDCINLVTEYVECGTLKNHIKNAAHFPWSVRISMARDIAAGMEYLHSSNLIHRDLNSNNCLVKEDGSVVVADFGLARWSRPEEEHVCRVVEHNKDGENSGESSTTTTTSSECGMRPRSRQRPRPKPSVRKMQRVGSPYWMAPEMLTSSDYDRRVDIFSYGIVLCEIIGRVDPDPDYLPRTTSFGLAVAQYYVQFALKNKCPQYFFAIAVTVSTDLDKHYLQVG